MDFLDALFTSNMEPLQQIYWLVAVGVSVVFLIQTILTFIGLDFDTDTDMGGGAAFDASGFDIFTIRSLVNFLLGFGWTGALFADDIPNVWLLNLLAVSVGAFFVWLIWFVMKQIMRFNEDGTFKVDSAVGITGDVYLHIPAKRGGQGKLQFSAKGTIREYDAVTDDPEPLATGTKARITEVIGSDILLVERVI